MEKVIILNGQAGSSLIIIDGSVGRLSTHLKDTSLFVITDENVERFHRQRFPPAEDIFVLKAGERTKNLKTVERIYRRLWDGKADRSSFILGIGGGVVCDLTGFAASTFLRGLDFGFVPTTLLAQVDAAIGGKNGVNLYGYKNMVGVINQPRFVLCDLSLLETLPQKELLCGLSEVIKSAAIASVEFFEFLEANWEGALERKREVLGKIVYEAALIKTSIVQDDEKERNERKKLNFGHTFAHALEKTCGMAHGEAISLGMILSVHLSQKKGLIPASEAIRIRELLRRFRLPVRFKFGRKAVLSAIPKDKKRKKGMIDFVLLKSLGEAMIQRLSFEELEEFVDDLC
jgi:3-dehydroquinate synthase